MRSFDYAQDDRTGSCELIRGRKVAPISAAPCRARRNSPLWIRCDPQSESRLHLTGDSSFSPKSLTIFWGSRSLLPKGRTQTAKNSISCRANQLAPLTKGPCVVKKQAAKNSISCRANQLAPLTKGPCVVKKQAAKNSSSMPGKLACSSHKRTLRGEKAGGKEQHFLPGSKARSYLSRTLRSKTGGEEQQLHAGKISLLLSQKDPAK